MFLRGIGLFFFFNYHYVTQFWEILSLTQKVGKYPLEFSGKFYVELIFFFIFDWFHQGSHLGLQFSLSEDF